MSDNGNEDEYAWTSEASMIPAKSADKKPMIEWKEYQTRKPTVEEMAKWKSEFRPTAWAFICGKVSNGIYVVDVDSVLAEHTVPGRFMRHFGPTKTVCTSGATPGEPDTGKRHFYFRDANVGKTISWTPRAKALDHVLVPGMEIKAEGGYVLAAGSKHPTGCIYSVIDDSPIKDVSYEMVVHTLEMVYRHWPLIATILPSYVTGTRTFWCTNLAGYAFHHKFTEEDALILVRTLAYAAVDPISTEADIYNAETAIHSTYARGRDGVSVGYKGEGGPQGAGWPDDLLAAIEALPDKARWPKGSVEFAEEEMRKRFGLAEREQFDLEERGGEIVVTPELVVEPKKKPRLAALTEKTDATALDDDGKVNTFLIAEAIRENMSVVGVWNGDDFVGHFRYLNGAYIRCKKYIKQAARDALGPKARNFHIAEIMGHLEVAETVDLSEFDCEDGKVCVQNGILDVVTQTLEPHTPERYFMKRLPIDFDPKAECPTIDAYFEQWLPGRSKALYEIVANTLIGWDYPIQSVVILIGGGGNGKSTYLLLITKFLGEDNVSAIEMQAFGENRFASAKLLGKWANICSDMDRRRIKSTSEFKKLTGGDPIQGEIKHGALFTFFNKAKMMFSLNELPQSPDDTEAFYRRVFKLRFNAKFKGKVRKSQRTIMAECYKEFPGLLNRCIDVLPGLLDRLAFDGDSDDVDEKKENYHRESRPVYGFWEDRLVYRGQEEGGGEVVDGLTKDEVFTAFRKYREEQELSVLAYDTFFRKLKEEFLNRDLPFEIGRPRSDSGNRKRVIVGLGFASQEAPPSAGPPSRPGDGGPEISNGENSTKAEALPLPGPPSGSHLLQVYVNTPPMSKDEVLQSIKEEASGEASGEVEKTFVRKDAHTKVAQQAIGSMDVESLNLDIEDPDNRIFSIALIGDLHPNGQVFAFDDESETIATFIDAASEYDGLLGWNSDYFDLPLMRARLGQDSGLMDGLPIVLDCMRTHKSMLRKNETDYSLDHVAKRHLGEGKIPFDFNRTKEIFDNDRETLKRYNLHDTKLVLRLNKMFGHWDTFNGIVKRAGLDSYNARKFAGISQKEEGFAWWRPLMGLVTQYCAQKGFRAPQWPSNEEKDRRRQKAIQRPGGFVETPKVGYHQNLIEYDFASLYPSLIRSLNLGADSCSPGGEIHAKFGHYVRTPRSVVAAILDELVAERSVDKAEYERRRAEGASPEELAALKGKTEAGKVLANSFYGQMYAPFSPLYHYESAKTITTTGQECVQLMLARMREMGYEVIAGDTDSTYIKVPPEHFNQESAMALSKELTKYVSEHFQKTYGVEFAGSFDFKGMLDHFYTEKKKFYAVLEHGKPMSSLGIKGYVRGNTPELQRDLQKKVFETMFSGGNIDSMLEAEGVKFLTGLDHTGLISWMVDRKGGKTAQAKAKRALGGAGITISRYEQVGFLIVGSGKKRKVLSAHRLPDSTVEWLWQGETILHRETNFLTPEEAAKHWDSLLKKLDGVSDESD